MLLSSRRHFPEARLTGLRPLEPKYAALSEAKSEEGRCDDKPGPNSQQAKPLHRAEGSVYIVDTPPRKVRC